MRVLIVVLGFLFIALPFGVAAHEVYVLSPDAIATAIASPSPSPFQAFATNRFQFFLWGFIALVVVSTIFFASITHRIELLFEPLFRRMRPWAAPVARVTLGLCLIASAYNGALFGPELPLSDFGIYGVLLRFFLYAAGVLITLNVYPQVGAGIALLIFAAGTLRYGVYSLTYLNYLGEILLALFLLKPLYEEYAFLVLRVCFGVSLAFGALYAKFVHSNLALATINDYQLTNYFHFDPLFIVLGACIIEVVMGIFFIVGFEIRHTSLFFLFWIVLSLLFFGESVWPHLILIGVNISLFMYGYDRWTVEGRYFNRGQLQPFL
jgi:hypothetical protein